MKRFIAILLALLVVMAAGCSKKTEQPKEQPKEQTQNQTQEQSQDLPQQAEAATENLWRAEDGSYVCIFPNGYLMAFDAQGMKQGQWSEENGNVTATFVGGISAQLYTPEESSLTYSNRQGTLQTEGKTYSPVADAEDFRIAAEQIDLYRDMGAESWMSQMDLNMGYGTTYQLWDGLEQLLAARLMQLPEDMTFLQEEEELWKQSRQEAMDEARAEFEGGTIASMMASSCGIAMTEDRFSSLMELLEAK